MKRMRATANERVERTDRGTSVDTGDVELDMKTERTKWNDAKGTRHIFNDKGWEKMVKIHG